MAYMNLVCNICSDWFNVPDGRIWTAKYCSRECYYKSRKTGPGGKSKCKRCGKEFLHSKSRIRTFCSVECRGLASRKNGVRHPTGLRKWLARRRKMDRCEKCGFSKEPKILGIHHKDLDSSNNDLSNLMVVCPNCHSLFHLRHTVQHSLK